MTRASGVLAQAVTLLLGMAIAVPVWSREPWLVLPRQMIGEFAHSEAPFYLYSSPGTLSERWMVPAVRKGTKVRLHNATPDYRWYRIEWQEPETSPPYIGWVEGKHLVVWWKGSKADAEPSPDIAHTQRLEAAERARKQAELDRARAQREQEERIRTEREQEAIRAEREAQRAALDRIRRKVEALQQTEQNRPAPNAERERIQAERESAERERAATQKERERRQEEQRRTAHQQEQTVQATHERLRWANTVKLTVIIGYFALFLFVVPHSHYHTYIHSVFSGPSSPRVSLLWLSISAAGVLNTGWMLWAGEARDSPTLFLLSGIIGLFFWFFVPGLLGLFFAFLHSLLVPHPLEAAFERMLRGEPISREETEAMAESLYNARRDGIPTDWRVQSRIWRLERLTALMGKEKDFMEKIIDHVLNQHRTERRN